MAANNPSYQHANFRYLLHFMPGEIVLRVDHDQYPNEDKDWIRRRLAGVPEIEGDRDLREAVTRNEENVVRILTFDRWETTGRFGFIRRRTPGFISRFFQRPYSEESRYFSLVFISLPGETYGYDESSQLEPIKHVNLLRKIEQIDQQLDSRINRSAPGEKAAPAADRPFILKRLTRARQPIFEVRGATFNWLSGAAQAVPTGGPGTEAVPEPGTTRVDGLEILDLHLPQPANQAVDVIILDSLPNDNGSQPLTAWLQNPATSQQLPDTPFTRWLKFSAASSASPQLIVHQANTPLSPVLKAFVSSGTTRLMDWLNDGPYRLQICEYPCDMSAHGLFVADIICGVMEQKCCSPRSIELYQVLNQWGVGTLETVTGALETIIKNLPSRSNPTVVNCSFTFLIPRLAMDGCPGHKLPGETECELKHANQQYNQAFRDDLCKLLAKENAQQVLQPLFNILAQKGVLCVAAAGNEWDNPQTGSPSTQRPIPRYPAALEHVIGVAALNDKGRNVTQAAPYSNRADDPPYAGFAVYGGGIAAGAGSGGKMPANVNNSITGLYLGEFCNQPQGSNDLLAHWSGTSFATPIIAGGLAALRTRGFPPLDAVNILKRLPHQGTLEGEEAIWVQ